MKKIDYPALPRCIGIVGSRSFDEYLNGAQKVRENIDTFVRNLAPGTLIVSGGARGVDRWAFEAADAYKLPTRVFLPSPDYPVPARFFIRNSEVVACVQAHEGLIAAFIDVDDCNGTADTIKKALAAELPVMIFKYKQDGKFLGWVDKSIWSLTNQN